MTAREAVGPPGYARARCGHCSACASNQMLRRTLPTAERTVTPVRQTKRKQAAIDKGDAIRERLQVGNAFVLLKIHPLCFPTSRRCSGKRIRM